MKQTGFSWHSWFALFTGTDSGTGLLRPPGKRTLNVRYGSVSWETGWRRRMGRGVFIHRSDSIYDDSPAERYQFPKQYLGRVQACVGDWVIYYEPSKVIDTRGYFAIAKVQEVIP